jgi:hypothetical protein
VAETVENILPGGGRSSPKDLYKNIRENNVRFLFFTNSWYICHSIFLINLFNQSNQTVMKKMSLFFLLAVLCTGCGFHSGLTRNTNVHNTNVILSERNFRVVSNVQGTSECEYIFGIGGMSKNAMIADARAQILQQADMVGKSRALVNETVEVHNLFLFIFTKRKITVTAQVIEFVDAKGNAKN